MEYQKLSWVERVVLFEKYSQERMAEVMGLTAQVMSNVDPKQAGNFLTKFVDATFPEIATSKEKTIQDKMKDLKEFSSKKVSLTPIPGIDGFTLNVEDPS